MKDEMKNSCVCSVIDNEKSNWKVDGYSQDSLTASFCYHVRTLIKSYIFLLVFQPSSFSSLHERY